MNNIQKGKRPVSQRSKPSLINSDDIFMNPLGLDAELTKVIDAKGYSYRYINYKQYIDMGGSHSAHWRPVSRKQLKDWGYDTISTHDFQSGSDADGYIRRQDLVLAIRPKEINEKHKQYLRQEAGRGKHIQAQHAEELRQLVRSSGLDAKVHEGYEDEGEQEQD